MSMMTFFWGRGIDFMNLCYTPTPLARIAKVGRSHGDQDPDGWVDEMCAMGLVSRPVETVPASRLADPAAVIPLKAGGTLAALLEERSQGS